MPRQRTPEEIWFDSCNEPWSSCLIWHSLFRRSVGRDEKPKRLLVVLKCAMCNVHSVSNHSVLKKPPPTRPALASLDDEINQPGIIFAKSMRLRKQLQMKEERSERGNRRRQRLAHFHWRFDYTSGWLGPWRPVHFYPVSYYQWALCHRDARWRFVRSPRRCQIFLFPLFVPTSLPPACFDLLIGPRDSFSCMQIGPITWFIRSIPIRLERMASPYALTP